MESSFGGELLELPGIYVDNFERHTIQKSKAYFLSHFHRDHTVGLDSELLLNKLNNEKNVFIYATKMTGAIIKHNYESLRPFIKVLNLGSNLITVNSTSNKELIINVTLIPAGHCVGSTMFFFETKSTKILYTGDFRIRSNDLPRYKPLHDQCGNVVKLDALYVDTTFIHEDYDDFPKRSDSVENIVEMISRWLENEDVCIVLDTSANYGYEYVFNEIYKILGTKVCVSPEKWEFYSTIQNLVPGVTNNPDDTRIFLKRIPESIHKTSKRCRRIRFSAMAWSKWSDGKASVASRGDDSYSVCFATHCSRTELMNFVNYLKPARVIGFPNSYCPDRGKTGARGVPETSLKKRSCDSDEGRPRKDRRVDDKLLKEMFGHTEGRTY